jgi:hypothetical protein
MPEVQVSSLIPFLQKVVVASWMNNLRAWQFERWGERRSSSSRSLNAAPFPPRPFFPGAALS